MRKGIINKHQTLIDIAIEHCGSTDAFFVLANGNGVGLTDDIDPGSELILPDTVDFRNQRYFQSSVFKPITGPIIIADVLGGIEFWAIETDFIVS